MNSSHIEEYVRRDPSKLKEKQVQSNRQERAWCVSETLGSYPWRVRSAAGVVESGRFQG